MNGQGFEEFVYVQSYTILEGLVLASCAEMNAGWVNRVGGADQLAADPL